MADKDADRISYKSEWVAVNISELYTAFTVSVKSVVNSRLLSALDSILFELGKRIDAGEHIVLDKQYKKMRSLRTKQINLEKKLKKEENIGNTN